jgi:hypothetical protein
MYYFKNLEINSTISNPKTSIQPQNGEIKASIRGSISPEFSSLENSKDNVSNSSSLEESSVFGEISKQKLFAANQIENKTSLENPHSTDNSEQKFLLITLIIRYLFI